MCNYLDMKMSLVEINIPDNIDLKGYDIKMLLAAKLYEDELLTSGQAAEVAGVSKRTFIEMLGRYGVSAVSDSIEDLFSDIANA